MHDDPAGDCGPRPGRRAVAMLLAAGCAMLGACGGSDGSSGTQPVAPPSGAAVMMGRASVVLNALPTQAPTSTGHGPDDPGRIVAVARDADGTVRLQQRDGTLREVTPDGTMTIRSAAPGSLQSDLPPSVIVAVDAANTVHMLDPEACAARTMAPDGRVATTSLPPPNPGQACASGTPHR